MPERDEMGNKTSVDGMLHTVQRLDPTHRGRRDIHNNDSYDDAYVCLTCPAEVCEGDLECFLKRKKQLEEEKRK